MILFMNVICTATIVCFPNPDVDLARYGFLQNVVAVIVNIDYVFCKLCEIK